LLKLSDGYSNMVIPVIEGDEGGPRLDGNASDYEASEDDRCMMFSPQCKTTPLIITHISGGKNFPFVSTTGMSEQHEQVNHDDPHDPLPRDHPNWSSPSIPPIDKNPTHA